MSTMLFADEVVDPDSIDELSGGRGRRGDQARARHRQAARRVARRPLRARQVPRQLPRGGPRPDRAQGGRRGDRRAAGEPRRRSRSPTSWRRSRRASTRCATRTPTATARPRQEGAGEAEGQVRSGSGSRKKAATQELAAGGQRVPPVGARDRHPHPACAAPTARGPGIAAPAPRARLPYLDRDGEPVEDPEVLAAHPRARDPAGVARTCGSARTPTATSRPPASTPPGASSTSTTTRWRERRDLEKFDDMVVFARTLPRAARARRRRPAPTATSSATTACCACAVRLLDRGFFRVGGEDYAVRNESYGLATMKQAATCASRGERAGLRLPGQVGPAPRAGASSTRASPRSWRDLQAPPRRRRRAAGLQARRGAGSTCAPRTSTPALKEATGEDVSAKDFRTWSATVLARRRARRLRGGRRATKTGRKRAITRAIKEVAHYLGNTPAVAAPPTSTRACSTATATA